MHLFLTLISGIAWTIVYVELIRKGFKEKTYGMPLLALALNIMWEGIYAFSDIVLKVHGEVGIQSAVNLIWFVCDVVIFFTFFKFGYVYVKHKISLKQFYASAISAIVGAGAFQIGIIFQFGFINGAVYSAFIQNLFMSILFVYFFFSREGTEGQSLTIGVAKWIGTLAPTILFGFMGGYSLALITGIACSIFDIIYMVLLSNKMSISNKHKAEILSNSISA
jgi:hypothetical protein